MDRKKENQRTRIIRFPESIDYIQRLQKRNSNAYRQLHVVQWPVSLENAGHVQVAEIGSRCIRIPRQRLQRNRNF